MQQQIIKSVTVELKKAGYLEVATVERNKEVFGKVKKIGEYPPVEKVVVVDLHCQVGPEMALKDHFACLTVLETAGIGYNNRYTRMLGDTVIVSELTTEAKKDQVKPTPKEAVAE